MAKQLVFCRLKIFNNADAFSNLLKLMLVLHSTPFRTLEDGMEWCSFSCVVDLLQTIGLAFR